MIQLAVDEWTRLCFGRRTVCFAVSIDHSRRLCDAFVSASIPARHVDASTKEAERRTIFKEFRGGDVLVLTSVNVLTEGSQLVLR